VPPYWPKKVERGYRSYDYDGFPFSDRVGAPLGGRWVTEVSGCRQDSVHHQVHDWSKGWKIVGDVDGREAEGRVRCV